MLVRSTASDGGAETYELSAPAEAAIRFLVRIEHPRAVVTRSRLATISAQAGRLARDSDPSASGRLSALRAERDALDAEIARAVEAEGADAVSLINTLLGMAVDAERRRPILSTVTGGLSGPCVKPIALRMVWQTAKAVRIPVIGLGGIASWRDAVEFMLAGATAVQIGTSNFVDPTVSLKVIDGIAAYCERHEFHHASELVGALETDG